MQQRQTWPLLHAGYVDREDLFSVLDPFYSEKDCEQKYFIFREASQLLDDRINILVVISHSFS